MTLLDVSIFKTFFVLSETKHFSEAVKRLYVV